MNATTSMAVASARIADDRRWAAEARQHGHAATPVRHPRGQWTGRLGAVATVLAACALVASIPAMAGAPAATDSQPRPMPAPAPFVITDFGG